MITVEIKDISRPKEAEVEIYMDRQGISLLIGILRALESKGGHDHLMTPSWAGDELDEKLVGKENTLVNHLRLTAL